MKAKQKKIWGFTQEEWDDMADGNAAQYGFPQNLVDNVERRKKQTAQYWKNNQMTKKGNRGAKP